MGDHQHRAVEAGHEPLELVAAAHVEVRLGLVEQQHVGAAREAGRERDELALAAAELARRARERGLGEPEVAQVHARLALDAVAAELGPAREQPLLVGERARHRVEVGRERRVGEPPLGGVQLGLGLGDLGPRGEHGRQRRAVVALDLLGQERVHEPAAADDVARVGVLEPGEDPQQRRLAAAVGAEHADPRAGGQLEVEPVEHAAAAEALHEPARGDQGDARHRPSSIGRGTDRGKAGSTRVDGRATPHPHRPRRPPRPRAGGARRRRRARPARRRRRPRLADRRPRRRCPSCPPPCAGSSSPPPASSSGCAPASSRTGAPGRPRPARSACRWPSTRSR